MINVHLYDRKSKNKLKELQLDPATLPLMAFMSSSFPQVTWSTLQFRYMDTTVTPNVERYVKAANMVYDLDATTLILMCDLIN